jgi:hypothetical protein
VFLLWRTKFVARGFYGRAEGSPVFKHGVWKEGRYALNRRTLALNLKPLHHMTNFFMQLLFSSSRPFAALPQVSVLGSFPPRLGSERSKFTQRLWSRHGYLISPINKENRWN